MIAGLASLVGIELHGTIYWAAFARLAQTQATGSPFALRPSVNQFDRAQAALQVETGFRMNCAANRDSRAKSDSI